MLRKNAMTEMLEPTLRDARTRSIAKEQAEKAIERAQNEAERDRTRGRPIPDIGLLAFIPLAFVIGGGVAYGNIGEISSLAFLEFPGFGWIMVFAIFYFGIIRPAKDVRWPFAPGLAIMIYPAFNTAPFILSLAEWPENRYSVLAVSAGLLLVWFGIQAWARAAQGGRLAR